MQRDNPIKLKNRGRTCKICPVFVCNKSQKRGSAELISSGTSEKSESFENLCWHTECPVKSDDFGGVFVPLAGKLFSVTKSISRN